jgi:alpha-glucosidase (family GH31 glycosyl hydrolase)
MGLSCQIACAVWLLFGRFQGGYPGWAHDLMNATARKLFINYWTAYLDGQGIDGIMTDIEGFAAGTGPSNPSWYLVRTINIVS